jgi:hypothetical protein
MLLLSGVAARAQQGSTLLGVAESEAGTESLTTLPLGWLDSAELHESLESPELFDLAESPEFFESPDSAELLGDPPSTESMVRPAVVGSADEAGSVQRIPSYVTERSTVHRVVRYDVPLTDESSHQMFQDRGYEGELIDVPVAVDVYERTSLGRLKVRFQGLFGLLRSEDFPKTKRVIRYEVPADEIALHTALSDLDGELIEPGMLRLPEVRFFQPKARVYMDIKRRNDDEFDLFSNGAVLASLDVVELYFPMPLISDRFARIVGKPSRLSRIGWRVGGTLGVGITTALNNGDSDNGSAPISTLSSGIRYEFPLGRPSRELLETGDWRLDQRTRVGIEGGIQGGVSTDESLADSTDVGMYFGILVNTPWNQGD